ncbi:RagB/SusD family nutrient uptake outer membrane protein [Sinomicrobium kalidii]|uniref:RagB/SusD family nutrient uptake outer membrane protein n=1 Tax=Sinomicrobium kalidii TaxID=2900738 RepID=UPI001E33F05F|nr:RagB/SusD family nutrient uptake outer membrane protein [Sinomicrobium kalidii]UGU15444.1 RagB/SusD family nutrient uptake outer membrane protein [Sinomicrobium kalidii]
MKRYITIALKAILVMVMVSGCQDIDLSPKDALDDSQFWKGPEDYEKAVNQLYSTMETIIYPDEDSDISYRLGPSDISNGTWSAPNDDSDWSDRFTDLRDCNKIIEKSESYEGDFAAIERYVAEARFFRAYNYWRLLRKFNSVPLITTILDTQSPELYSERAPQSEVEDFILTELESIAESLPEQSELTSDELGRVTRGAALALRARVALFAGTWAKYHEHRSDYTGLLDIAINSANRVIQSGEYSLYEGAGEESYRKLFIDDGDDSPEGILDNRYELNVRTHSTGSSVYWGWRGSPTRKLADMYLSKSTGLPIEDPDSGFMGYDRIADEFEGRDPRMRQTILVPGTTFQSPEGQFTCVADFSVRPETRTGYKLWKYMSEIEVAGSGQTTFDVHIIRYAEVLLILAEATFEKQGAISDDLLDATINVIRNREGVEMPGLTNSFVRENGLDMQTEIRRERTIELAFEGFRRDDLRRWRIAETELRGALKGIKYEGTEYEELDVLEDGNPGLTDENGFLIVEPADNRFFEAPRHYYYPVPLNEIALNPQLAPNNPGWE